MEPYQTLSQTETVLHNDLDTKKKLVQSLIQEAISKMKVDRQSYENDVCRIYIQILNDSKLQFKVNLNQKYRESLKHILRTEAELLTNAGYQVIQHSSDSFYFLLKYQTPMY